MHANVLTCEKSQRAPLRRDDVTVHACRGMILSVRYTPVVGFVAVTHHRHSSPGEIVWNTKRGTGRCCLCIHIIDISSMRAPGRGGNQKRASGNGAGERISAFANLNLLSKRFPKQNVVRRLLGTFVTGGTNRAIRL